MKQLRKEGINDGTDHNGIIMNKETRWDRIRKRCTAGNSAGAGFSLKTETIKHFIETDYIGKRNANLLHGEKDIRNILDPALVMDIRHEMFQKIPKKLPLATVAQQNNLPTCRAHNLAVEQRFIDNELNKLREQLEKERKRHEIKLQFKKEVETKNLHFVDNQVIMDSLEATSIHIEDFYATPIEALQEVEELCKIKDEGLCNGIGEELNIDDIYNDEEMIEEVLKKAELNEELKETLITENGEGVGEVDEFEINENSELEKIIQFQVECRTRAVVNGETDVQCLNDFVRRTPSPLTPTDEFLKPMRDAALKHQAEIRRVRFEDEVNLQKFERENSTCSNTSDGLDSIISDLAEEALLELQMEEEQENQAKFNNKEHQQEVEQQEEDQQEEQHQYEKQPCELHDNFENFETSKNSIHQPKLDTNSKQTKITKLEIIGEKSNTKNFVNDNDELLLIKPIKIPKKQKKNNENRNGNRNETTTVDDIDSNDDDNDEEETISIHEQNLIIEQLFQSRAHTNIVTMRKYFLKWIHYTTISKIERENMSSKNDRIQQINAFLDKIRKEKVRIAKTTKEMNTDEQQQQGQHGKYKPHENSEKSMQQKNNLQITKKYQSKIKMQQDIIDLQRLKLERQERLIMELKLKKLSDEAKEARQEIKNELKAVIRSGDAKAKAKAKCLQLIGNLRDAEDDDEFKRLQGKALLMPKFLQKMQERALERSIRHEQARQRRLQQEAEREAQKIAAEEAKRQEDEEAKRMRLEALKEKRRQEKMAKILKERERQRAIENNKKAQEFNRHRLLKRIGMEGFKRLLQRKKEYTKKSEILRRIVIKRTYFLAWRDYYRFELSRRIQRAEKLYCFILKRQALKFWLNYVAMERSNYYVAVDWYDLKLGTYMFKEWAAYTERMRKIEESKMRKAISHYEWNLKFKVLDCWQRLPQILQLEKETEERRQRWRMKIWELLPDYTPRLDAFV